MRAMSISPLSQAVGRPELHPRRIGVGEHVGAAVLADIFGIVADQPVALAGDSMLHLAGGGELEALLDAALRLQFGHFRLLGHHGGRTFENSHGSPCEPGGSILPKLERAGPVAGEGREGKNRRAAHTAFELLPLARHFRIYRNLQSIVLRIYSKSV